MRKRSRADHVWEEEDEEDEDRFLSSSSLLSHAIKSEFSKVSAYMLSPSSPMDNSGSSRKHVLFRSAGLS